MQHLNAKSSMVKIVNFFFQIDNAMNFILGWSPSSNEKKKQRAAEITSDFTINLCN